MNEQNAAALAGVRVRGFKIQGIDPAYLDLVQSVCHMVDLIIAFHRFHMVKV